MPLNEILTLPATELAARIRARELSPLEVVDAYIRRIEEVNPIVNAVVAHRFDAARDEARRAEAALAGSDPVPSLLGVPFTVKEMINLEGMPTTFGTRTRLGRTADRDATIVRRLREAGAIPLGVTNIPEWGFWFETDNLIYGRTRNPYDLRRTAGGSSGGEAAILAAAGSGFGLGSDIGGSIRIPAAFCGVYGHKPTHGLLPLTGHYPVYETGPEASLPKVNHYLAVGPLTRAARDLMPLLRIMAGDDGVDPNTRKLPLGSLDDVAWRGRPVYLLEAPQITLAAAASPAVRDAVRTAARVFENLGAVVEPLPDTLFRQATHLWFAALRYLGGPPVSELLGDGRSISLIAEFALALARRPRYTVPALVFCLGERLGQMSERRIRSLVAQGRRLAQRIGSLLEDGILLLPPHPRVAPLHNRPLLRPFDFAYTAIFNVLRLPVTVAPVGRDEAGLPLAVQIVAGRGHDHRTIAAAIALEDALGGWRPADPTSRS